MNAKKVEWRVLLVKATGDVDIPTSNMPDGADPMTGAMTRRKLLIQANSCAVSSKDKNLRCQELTMLYPGDPSKSVHNGLMIHRAIDPG